MLPILVIAIGLVVLAFGKRLSVLGAAVGALLGVALLRYFPDATDSILALAIPILLAVIGFFLAGISKAFIDIILLVIGTLAGAAIVMNFLDIFQADLGLIGWLLVVVGGVAGLILVRSFKDWAMILLAGVIGGLLITRGLSAWLPFLEGIWGTLLVIVLAAAGIAYQGGFIARLKSGASQPAAPK